MMNKEQILSLTPGPEMEGLIINEIKKLVGEKIEIGPFTTDELVAMKFRDELALLGFNICNIKYSNLPNVISEGCIIQDEEDESKWVLYATSSFAESMSVGFLLYVNDHYGEHLPPKFTEKMKKSPVKALRLH